MFALISVTPMIACGDSTAARMDTDDEVGEGDTDEAASESADGAGESGTAGADENAETIAGDADGGMTTDGNSSASTGDGDGDTETSDADTAMGDTTTDDSDGGPTTGDGDTTTDGDDSAVQVDVQCKMPYKILDLADRNQQFNDGDGNVEWCDRINGGGFDSQWVGPNWYRFMDDAGTRMPEFPPMYHSCGTEAPGWLLEGHPEVGDGVVPRTVCFSWAQDTCQWEANIEVVDCADFYLYNLDNTTTCALRYCGTD